LNYIFLATVSDLSSYVSIEKCVVHEEMIWETKEDNKKQINSFQSQESVSEEKRHAEPRQKYVVDNNRTKNECTNNDRDSFPGGDGSLIVKCLNAKQIRLHIVIIIIIIMFS
jgi:hypothetical protein